MKIHSKYSHLNGLEWLKHHHPNCWDEIENALDSVDAEKCKTKKSKEKTMKGKLLYSPDDMNKAIQRELHARGWKDPKRYDFVLTHEAELVAEMIDKKLTIDEQVSYMKKLGKDFQKGHTKADFFKNKISIEIQFGKYSFVQYDIFVKHAADYMHNRIDLGIEIVPMKSLEKEMSSGPSNYERNLHEILRQGRIFPPVPLILIGIIP